MAAPTIFLIDDHASVRDALGEMLSVFGYSVKAYESADAFLATVNKGEPGCIVADVKMPGTDGIGLVRELARRGIAMPVVLISGHADVPMAVDAIKSERRTLSKSRLTTGNWLPRSIARSLGGICRNRQVGLMLDLPG